MNGLARASVRFRPASFVGTFVALLFASVVVTACGALLQTGITAHVAPVRYAHVPVVVAPHPDASIHVRSGGDDETESEPLTDTPRLPAGTAARVAAQPGVAAAVADVAFPVQGAGLPAVTGRNWDARLIDGAAAVQGRAPGAGEVVLDPATARAAHTAPGRTVTLTTPAGSALYRVAGLTASSAATAYFADDAAGRLSGHPGLVDAVAVLPEPGVSTQQLADRARHAVGSAAVVRTGDGRGAAEQPQLAEAREMLTALGGSFGGVATATAVFVVMGTVSLAIGQRAREIALLRAIGATPRQIRRTVATEALLVAPLAGAAGILPGVGLARWWLGQLVHKGAVPHGVRLEAGWIPMVVSVGAGLLAALTAGLLAARRPSKARPSAALGEAAVERRRPGVIRTVLGVAAIAGGIVLSVVAAHTTGDDAASVALGIVFSFMVGVALLGPVVAWLASALLGVPLRAAGGAPGELAAANTRANARRLASAITPIVLVTAFAGTLLCMQSSVAHASSRQVRDGVVADQIIGSAGAGLPAGTAGRAAATPGVGSAVEVLRSGALYRASGSLNSTNVLGVGGDPAALPAVLDLDVRAGSLARLTGDGRTVALDTLLAGTVKAHVGDRVQLWLGDGTTLRPTVVAVYGRGLGLGSVLLPRTVVAPHASSALATQVLVHDAPGADHDAVRHALARLDVPGLTVTDRAGYRAQADRDLELNGWANRVMTGVLGGFAAVAAANTLVMTVLDRRREVALLRLAGTTRGQVLRMLRAEALLVAAAGLGIGALIAWITLIPIARGLTGTHPYVSPLTALALTTATLALTLTSTSLPARTLLHHPPTSPTP
ncbi:FtsX-like permease family protein [Actinacidiphila epipremni]|uniref:ABC transporter permease n=1 Tax=Actinacidiphila epipremni TaxID=2053013 RepID=A0ABX0ZGV5_9ACTN|nr:FtsX-like permease family protein [Actinacidiphila epipremni]NJP42037.1 ABC transporter permease [Actinacidiphila epipremni]